MSENQKKFLLVKGKAGFGNRMLVVLDSILYAELVGREMVIDWRDGSYAPVGVNSFPLMFEMPLPGDPAALEQCDSVAPAIWRGHLPKSVDNLFALHFPHDEEMDTVERVAARYTVNTWRADGAETVAVRWGWSFDIQSMRSRFTGALARYRGMTDEEILRTVLKERVVLNRELQAKIEAFRAAHFTPHTLGVHVRYSDRQDTHEGCFRFVQEYMERHPDGSIFLATDSAYVEEVFRGKYPRVYTTQKWLPPAGVAIHRNTLPDRDPLRNAHEALIDLYLLRECDGLVYDSRSTFSIIAKLLSKATPDARVDAAPKSIKPLLRRSLRRVRNVANSLTSAIGI